LAKRDRGGAKKKPSGAVEALREKNPLGKIRSNRAVSGEGERTIK